MSVESKDEDCAVTFKSMGLDDALCQTVLCEKLKWTTPTRIQMAAIPMALKGNDIIGIGETGSGKTGAFALPIIHDLLRKQRRMFALVLTPTRELAEQISLQFKALGAHLGVQCVVLVGGMEMKLQQKWLLNLPHIIIATPGRLMDHIENTNKFNLCSLQYLVIDEADSILNLDFKEQVDKILAVIPQERRTYLYSATMTKKVQELKRACLRNPVTVDVSTACPTVENLIQYYLYIPKKLRDIYLVYLLNDLQNKSCIVFCDTCVNTRRVALILDTLGFQNVHPFHGQMKQKDRVSSLSTFSSKKNGILVATNVAARGLDIRQVDVVINLYMVTDLKDYIHRVGRTARAGRTGTAYTFVTLSDVLEYKKLESGLGRKLDCYEPDYDDVMSLEKRVNVAQQRADEAMSQEPEPEKKTNRKRGYDEDVEAASNEKNKPKKTKKR